MLLNQVAISPVVASSQVAEAKVAREFVRMEVAEANDIRFTRLSRSQGLSQQRVTHIVQDDQGFMWFGTQYGLNRYDGYRFRVFKHDPQDASSLCGVYIYSLFKDRSGALWVGCDFSLDRYDPETESFIHYRLDPALPLNPASRVMHISEDDAGHLWFSTGNGLYRLDPQTQEVTRFQHSADDPTSIGSNDVMFSQQDRRGDFWVGTTQGLEKLDPQSGRVTLRLPISETRGLGFYEDKEGVFWVYYASGNGLAIYDADTQVLTPYSFKPTEAEGKPTSGVSYMLEDDLGTLWIGTLSDGLLMLDRERQRFLRYRYDPPDRFSLPENRVTTLAKDKEGSVWVGLGATEPVLFGRPQPFTALPFDAYHAANLGERLVNSIHQDADETLWVGTTGALNRIDRSTGQTQRFEVPGNTVASDVLAIARDRAGKLWLGTSGQGLYRLDESTGALRAYRHSASNPASLSNDTVLDIWAGNEGELWIATFDGLNRLDLDTGRFAVYRHLDDARPIYASIAQDSAGYFWLAGYGSGIVRFDPRTERFELFGDSDEADKRLSDNRINSLTVDSEGAAWAATQNGLNRFDPATGLIEAYFEFDGLASNAVSCVLEDSNRHIWAGTSNGLSRLDRRGGTVRNYAQADGLPGPDLTGWSACFRGPRGEMFFGGFSGAVAFMPESVRESTFIPPIVLTDFRVFGVPVDLDDDSPLERSIAHTSNLTLPHDKNTIAFEFAALSFRNPETNRYRFKLEGLESDWQLVGSDRRFATYTTLAPGSYRFRVQGATSRGHWGEPGLTLDVAILPPWWGTWWFRLAVLICLIAIAWAAYRYRIRQIGRRFAIELDARVRERTRIARELHDSLLQGFQAMMFTLQAVRRMLPSQPDRAAQTLERAMDRGDQAIAEGREAVQSLRTSNDGGSDLTEAVASLRAELESLHSRQLPSYRVIVTGQPKVLCSPVRDEVYRITQEAFRNAVMHAEATRIEIEIEYAHTKLRVNIRDDGLGIDVDILARGQRTGHFGLPGMRERAAGLRGSFNVRSKRGAGTEIELQIPANVAYARNAAVERAMLQATHE